MTKNRLNLDYTLVSQKDRTNYVQSYIQSLSNLTEKELSQISDYILWGTNSSGQNLKQEGLAQLETRYKTWDSPHQDESLDALLENPAFSENVFKKPEEPVYRTPKIKLDRDEIRKSAPQSLLKEFEILWKRIDLIDLQIELYELQIGKRTLEIRKSLLLQFTPQEISQAKEQVTRITPNDYIKLRHQLVELRREQYTYKDFYNAPIQRHTERPFSQSFSWDLGGSIRILPLSRLKEEKDDKIWQKNFKPDEWDEASLRRLSQFLWMEDSSSYRNGIFFDFGDANMLYATFQVLGDLEESAAQSEDPESNLQRFLDTLKFYTDIADLDELERDLLAAKIQKMPNADIAALLNKRYGKHYNCNYISTLWCRRVLVEIADAAKLHREKLELLFFPEEWKKCTCCGENLLRDTRYFMRKKNSKDGLAARCKKCEKQKRLEREGRI